MKLGGEAYFPPNCPAQHSLHEPVGQEQHVMVAPGDQGGEMISYVTYFTTDVSDTDAPRTKVLHDSFPSGSPEGEALRAFNTVPGRK